MGQDWGQDPQIYGAGTPRSMGFDGDPQIYGAGWGPPDLWGRIGVRTPRSMGLDWGQETPSGTHVTNDVIMSSTSNMADPTKMAASDVTDPTKMAASNMAAATTNMATPNMAAATTNMAASSKTAAAPTNMAATNNMAATASKMAAAKMAAATTNMAATSNMVAHTPNMASATNKMAATTNMAAPSTFMATPTNMAAPNMAAATPNMAATPETLRALLPVPQLRSLARHWLHEDCPGLDPAAMLVGLQPISARIVCKSRGLLAGLPFVDAILDELGCSAQWRLPEGSHVTPNAEVALLKGPAAHILQGERTLLDVLSRCSGTATAAMMAVEVGKALKWPGVIAGTRKTTPGFRLVEKYGLKVGGADTHRYDIGGMLMVKDTHRDAVKGGMKELVEPPVSVAAWRWNVEAQPRPYKQQNMGQTSSYWITWSRRSFIRRRRR
ncbi:nicotinate-nucleotide pyrophosphorylase [carboxylating] isoform X2 [Coturnix japonica]|uniref:nicotinate-nucleotide pyrophosphorylase [carboxylating] isoform X2 n=1 Tax=Coturnix japonica TaxID=93934 RepID=UPI0013A5D467|nr:nicotinate-nucleotide pyrophosphorylase [carboxylating] isoform X2 [Coturnix japonica]